MKKHLFIIGLTMLISFSLFSQNFISSNKQWNVLQTGFGYNTEIFKIEGDSLMEATTYSKIWVSYDSTATWIFQGLLREDSNVVYFIPPGLNEGILYDFNLEIGDSVFVKNIFCGDEEIPISIIDIDTVDYFGIPRKRWHLGEEGYVAEFWVEGIGSLNGPLYTKYWHCIVCPVWELLCYHNNGVLEYIMPGQTNCFQTPAVYIETKRENDFEIKPNPVKKGNNLYIELPSKANSIRIYNSAGLHIKTINPANDNKITIETNSFEPGLYFITITTNQNSKTHKILIE